MTASPVQFSSIYGFIRSRQLEGTFPGDRKRGVWGITSKRIARGWGMVLESDWPHPTQFDSWPPSEPSDLDSKAKKHRILSYQRITDSYEAKIAIASRGGVGASFPVTEQWFRAEKGVIEAPRQGAEIVGSHAVTLIGYSDAERRFTFKNSWGKKWGDGGFGYLPYDFFDLFLLEAWTRDYGQAPPIPAKAGVVEMSWAKPDFMGRIFHARELYDIDSDERLGWAFAVQEHNWLNVEEFFVRPQYRRRGYGNRLLHGLEGLSAGANLPLRFFVPFADCQPKNLVVAEHLLAKGKYILVRNDLPWSPCMAVPIVNAQSPPFDLPEPAAYCAKIRTRTRTSRRGHPCGVGVRSK